MAHFHNVIIGGVVFAVFAAITYWFPKAFGYRLNEFWGKCSFWCWLVGFWVAFTPLYILGLMGVTRRVSHFEADPSKQMLFIIASLGACIIAAGIVCFFIQLWVSFRQRAQLRDLSGDPWNGRTLEWATASPPPQYNFAFTPVVHEIDAWWDMKKHGYQRPVEGFKPIHMPSNTAAGVVIATFATLLGFALIWHMWPLACMAFAALIVASIVHTFNYQRDYHIPVQEVSAQEAQRTAQLAQLR